MMVRAFNLSRPFVNACSAIDWVLGPAPAPAPAFSSWDGEEPRDIESDLGIWDPNVDSDSGMGEGTVTCVFGAWPD